MVNLTHKFVSTKTEQPDTTLVGSNEWNAKHVGYADAYTLVTLNGPTDGGDYGPNTPGTTTAGIQEALNSLAANGGVVSIEPGNYYLPAGFAGINLGSYQKVVIDEGASLIVPNGYTGYVFKIFNISRVEISGGGILQEAGTPKQLWDGVLLSSDFTGSNGVYFCIVRGLRIIQANYGVRLQNKTSASAFINSNVFEDLRLDNCNAGVYFDNTSSDNFNRNTFISCWNELSGVANLIGFKNIDGIGNLFLNCAVWDVGAGGHSATVAAPATLTKFIGGTLNGGTLTDSGTFPSYIDEVGTVPQVVKSDVQSALTATRTAVNFTPNESAATYEVEVYIDITAVSGGDSLVASLAFTDIHGTRQNAAIPVAALGASSWVTSMTGVNVYYGKFVFRASNTGTIIVQFVVSGTGAITYDENTIIKRALIT